MAVNVGAKRAKVGYEYARYSMSILWGGLERFH